LLVKRFGVGEFLFERPAWARLPGTAGSRTAPVVTQPAE
jgi:hypothetical protein